MASKSKQTSAKWTADIELRPIDIWADIKVVSWGQTLSLLPLLHNTPGLQ